MNKLVSPNRNHRRSDPHTTGGEIAMRAHNSPRTLHAVHDRSARDDQKTRGRRRNRDLQWDVSALIALRSTMKPFLALAVATSEQLKDVARL